MKLEVLDQFGPKSCGEPSVCEACGETFACGATQKSCWCSEMTLSAELRSRLRLRYQGCLCRGCLERLSASPIEDGSIAGPVMRESGGA